MSKKIVIYGENWLGTLPKLLNDELVRRGYDVVHFDFTDILPGIKHRSFIQRVQRILLNQFYVNEIQKAFCRIIDHERPDLVIIAKGLHIKQQTLKYIKDNGTLLVNWNPDDFFNMKNSSELLIKSMPYYDLIVSSRDHLFDKYKEYGANQLLFLDWYYVPELHFDHGLTHDINVSFVGSWSPNREEFISKIDRPLMIWGGGWEKSQSNFRKKHHVNKVILSQIEMSKVFNRSRFNLNLLTNENSDYTNLRFFEVPASKGLLLTERNQHSIKLLQDGKECLMFESVKDVNSVLNNSYDYNSIAKSGYKRIIADSHSFSDRVQTLLKNI